MIRHYMKQIIKVGVFPLSLFNDPDNVDLSTNTAKTADLSQIENETGWERVKNIFLPDEFGGISPEASIILQAGGMSTFVGALYGGIMSSKGAYGEFMANNQATTFTTHLEAKRKLQDKITTSFGSGAFKWGWRLTLFTTSFVGISTVVASYRGKSGILEYVIAGGVSGSMYKFNAGPKGWIVGGCLGSVLGLFCGGMTLGLLSLTGMSMKEVRYWQGYLKNERSETYRKGLEKYIENEKFAVIKLHDIEVGESGKHIDNLESSPEESKKKINLLISPK